MFGLRTITTAAIIVTYILHLYINSTQDDCSINYYFWEEVFTYDSSNRPISRKEAFIAGKIKQNQPYLIIGIPTVYRTYNNSTASYILKTLGSLITPLTAAERETILILLLLAEENPIKRKSLYELIKDNFDRELREGLINIIGIPKRFYLPLHNIPTTYNNSEERVYWRSKQCLDYVFMFDYVYNQSKYYMHIEDDVIAKREYYEVVKHIISFSNIERESTVPWNQSRAISRELWVVKNFYLSGFIGCLIPTAYLKTMAVFIKVLYYEVPVDLLYPELIELMKIKTHQHESLFTHIGFQSSSLGT